MPANQANDANSPVRIESNLGSKLLVESFDGDEELGRPFVFNLSLLSYELELPLEDVVGQRVTIILSLSQGERYFDGFVTEFQSGGTSGDFARYSAVVRPWLWFMTQTTDCRIFQEMSIPDIIQELFGLYGTTEYEINLTSNYPILPYCVQYRESDFTFISRLMESVGIYYYFQHDQGEHKMVLVDSNTSHDAFPDHSMVSFSKGYDRMEIAGVFDFWRASQTVVPNNYAMRDYNFEKPKLPLLSKSTEEMGHDSFKPSTEIYDYPGEYSESGVGSDIAKIRLQELQCKKQRSHCGGTYRGIASGHHIELENHFREDQNTKYLVVSVLHTINNAAFITQDAKAAELYRCQAEFLNYDIPFRPARETRKPIVQGPQTAVVVGTGGMEIDTDKNGSVKVQFHWDRYGENDENSSCWVRVSQLWAGANWGAIHIPRMGQEVVVDFLEGDPDRPLITGRVYNADHEPPYDLPDNKTQSGIKSRSTLEGEHANFNEFRFEDKKGEEEIYLQAERDLTSFVENDENRTTINTRSVLVGDEENKRPAETIETLVVEGKREIKIHGDDILTVLEGENGRAVDIEDGSYELLVQKVDHIITVQEGNSTNTVNQDITTESQEGDISTTASQGDISTLASAGDISTIADAGDISTEAGSGDISIKAAAGKITMEAAQEIQLKVGANVVKISQSGVEIKGAMFKAEGSATAEMKSPATTVKGDGMLTLKGGVTMIN